MTTGDFADLVGEMRKAQKSYFRMRSKKALEKSKALEQEVDRILLERKEREVQAANQSLFDE